GDDAESDVDLFLLGIICRAAASAAFPFARQAMRLPYNRQCRSVFLAAQPFDLVENRAENVGLVIRRRSRKLGEIFCTLDNCYRALEAHSSIDVARRQWDIFSLAGVTAPGYRLRIELDEHEIPNFNAARVVLVHERTTRVAVWRQIDVHFRARPAWTGV